MKSLIPMTMSFLLAITLQAQQPPASENADTNRANSTGQEQRQTNARVSLNQVVNELQNDPQALFDRLDRDGSGQLSKEEFSRMTNAGVEGTAATQGTAGTTASGAAANPGNTGHSTVQGNPAAVAQPLSPQPQEQNNPTTQGAGDQNSANSPAPQPGTAPQPK